MPTFRERVVREPVRRLMFNANYWKKHKYAENALQRKRNAGHWGFLENVLSLLAFEDMHMTRRIGIMDVK